MPKVIFIEEDGKRVAVEAETGQNLMELARDNGIDIEGACEGAMACSTCHLIVDAGWFEKLDPASEEEEDILDLAYGLTATSRLGCQIVVSDELDGILVTVPAG